MRVLRKAAVVAASLVLVGVGGFSATNAFAEGGCQEISVVGEQASVVDGLKLDVVVRVVCRSDGSQGVVPKGVPTFVRDLDDDTRTAVGQSLPFLDETANQSAPVDLSRIDTPYEGAVAQALQYAYIASYVDALRTLGVPSD